MGEATTTREHPAAAAHPRRETLHHKDIDEFTKHQMQDRPPPHRMRTEYKGLHGRMTRYATPPEVAYKPAAQPAGIEHKSHSTKCSAGCGALTAYVTKPSKSRPEAGQHRHYGPATKPMRIGSCMCQSCMSVLRSTEVSNSSSASDEVQVRLHVSESFLYSHMILSLSSIVSPVSKRTGASPHHTSTTPNHTTQDTLARRIFSCFSALITMSRVWLKCQCASCHPCFMRLCV